MFDVANILKNISVKDVPINNHEFLNIQACPFHVVWNKGYTQSLVVSCKYMYWVVPLVPTRVSGYGQAIHDPFQVKHQIPMYLYLSEIHSTDA